jgi:multidrug efflux system membrane fusion protein
VVDGAAHLQAIQSGITEGTNTSVRSGLNGGEQVVVDGFDRLADKAKVRLRPPTASATLTPTGVSDASQENEGSAPTGGGRRPHGKGAGSPPPGVGTRKSRKGMEGQKQ